MKAGDGKVRRASGAPPWGLDCILRAMEVSSCLLGETDPRRLSSRSPQRPAPRSPAGLAGCPTPTRHPGGTRPPGPCALAPPSGTEGLSSTRPCQHAPTRSWQG
ncbi:unnamed protein product [Rangifer tarandus platyrhynchus]|uniref:Uncharacterized protein n=1 Tax=Rangifer tarandus platyrhynchus TaxID=3082113 RepID=A0AC59Y4J3_RANTA